MARALTIAALVLVLSHAVGLQFYLQEGQTLCFGENIAPNSKVLGEYTVAAGQGHMPVDIVVRDLLDNKTIFERNDINHGKYAFITPFGKEAPHVHSADLHRQDAHHHHAHHDDLHVRSHDSHEDHWKHDDSHDVHWKHEHEHERDHEHDHDHRDVHHYHHDAPPEHEHGHDWDSHRHHDGDNIHEERQHRQTRRLLSYDSEHAQQHGSEHRPSGGHESEHEWNEHHHDKENFHEHDYKHDRDEHEHDHEHEHEHEHNHDFQHVEGKLDHMDAHDGDHADMEDEWDLDKYDGLHDEDLEKDWEENEKHAPHIDEDEEGEELFKERKFEICVSSKSPNNALRRRVRLLMRHGKAAHDYTRLAKTEHMSSLELTLRIVSDELKELNVELDHARQMEETLRKLNEHTNRRVVRYAALSLFVLVGVSTFQGMYTKMYFKKKKLV